MNESVITPPTTGASATRDEQTAQTRGLQGGDVLRELVDLLFELAVDGVGVAFELAIESRKAFARLAPMFGDVAFDALEASRRFRAVSRQVLRDRGNRVQHISQGRLGHRRKSTGLRRGDARKRAEEAPASIGHLGIDLGQTHDLEEAGSVLHRRFLSGQSTPRFPRGRWNRHLQISTETGTSPGSGRPRRSRPDVQSI